MKFIILCLGLLLSLSSFAIETALILEPEMIIDIEAGMATRCTINADYDKVGVHVTRIYLSDGRVLRYKTTWAGIRCRRSQEVALEYGRKLVNDIKEIQAGTIYLADGRCSKIIGYVNLNPDTGVINTLERKSILTKCLDD